MRDYKHTGEGDIDLSAGDFDVAESTEQHQKDILLSGKGYYKECPVVGVGIHEYIHDTDPDQLFRAIRQEMTRDGMKVKEVGAQSGELIIDASYEGS